MNFSLKKISKNRLVHFLMYVGICILVSMPTKLFATNYSGLKFEHLRTNNGLSNSTVNAIAQDGNGFLWFATNDGLNKYNGHDFTIYRHVKDDSTSLIGNRVNALVTDRKGQLWIGTTSGLSVYNATKDCFVSFQHEPENNQSLQNNAITYLFYDSIHNYLWISADPEGLCRIDLNNFNLNAKSSSVIFERYPISEIRGITAMLKDQQKHLIFLGRDENAHVYQKTSDDFSILPLLDAPEENLQRKSKVALIDRDQKWWILSGGKGYVFEAFSSRNEVRVKHLKSVNIWSESLIQDHNGNLWAGNESIEVIDPATAKSLHRFSRTESAYSISNSELKCLFLDDNNILWIGTSNDGINKCRLSDDFFSYYDYNAENSKGLSGKVVTSMLEDLDGNIWFSLYDGGISIFNQTTHQFKPLNSDNSQLSSNKVLDLHQGADGTIWAGTWTGGFKQNSAIG